MRKGDEGRPKQRRVSRGQTDDRPRPRGAAVWCAMLSRMSREARRSGAGSRGSDATRERPEPSPHAGVVRAAAPYGARSRARVSRLRCAARRARTGGKAQRARERPTASHGASCQATHWTSGCDDRPLLPR